MAKNSMVQRELKRSRLVAKYAQKRSELKALIKSADASYEEKMAAVEKLQKLPRDSAAADHVGHARAVLDLDAAQHLAVGQCEDDFNLHRSSQHAV